MGVKMNKAVFLDRDGTINVDKGYLYKIEDFEFIDRVPEAIRIMKHLGYLVIVLSNQSGIARGYFREEDVLKLHCYMNKELEKMGAAIDKFYFCPHLPDGIIARYRCQCICRKPAIGMLQWALRDFSIDLEESWVVGDRERDLFLDFEAPIKRILLTRNYGQKETGNRINIRND